MVGPKLGSDCGHQMLNTYSTVGLLCCPSVILIVSTITTVLTPGTNDCASHFNVATLTLPMLSLPVTLRDHHHHQHLYCSQSWVHMVSVYLLRHRAVLKTTAQVTALSPDSTQLHPVVKVSPFPASQNRKSNPLTPNQDYFKVGLVC